MEHHLPHQQRCHSSTMISRCRQHHHRVRVQTISLTRERGLVITWKRKYSSYKEHRAYQCSSYTDDDVKKNNNNNNNNNKKLLATARLLQELHKLKHERKPSDQPASAVRHASLNPKALNPKPKGPTHRPLSSSFLWLIFRTLKGNPRKELLRAYG